MNTRYQLLEGKAYFRLRDYLSPGAKYPYNDLFKDLDAAFDEGIDVYLWSVPGYLILAGHPGHGWHLVDDDMWFDNLSQLKQHKAIL
jgi:hypothetical protein